MLHAHTPNVHLLEVAEHYNRREKTSWENRLRKKHPILSGVEISHKHIPFPILILSYFNIGKYSMCLNCWDASPKHHTSVARHNTASDIFTMLMLPFVGCLGNQKTFVLTALKITNVSPILHLFN